jgi:hypothetical protein
LTSYLERLSAGWCPCVLRDAPKMPEPSAR